MSKNIIQTVLKYLHRRNAWA